MSCLSDPPEIKSVSEAKTHILVSFANTYFVTALSTIEAVTLLTTHKIWCINCKQSFHQNEV